MGHKLSIELQKKCFESFILKNIIHYLCVKYFMYLVKVVEHSHAGLATLSVVGLSLARASGLGPVMEVL